MRFARLAAVAAIGALGIGAASAAAADPDSPRAADAELSRAMRDLVAMPGGPPGAISIINRNGRVKSFAWGRADARRPGVPGSGMHMRVASTSKAFTAAAALALVYEGRMSLDQTIGALRPDLPVAWHGATVAQVLRHTAGLPDYSAAPPLQQALIGDPANPPDPLALIAFVAGDPLEFTPGSRFEYSNTGPIVVGLVIEAVTGRSYADALAEQVSEPLRLLRTSLPRRVDLPAPTVRGYDVTGGRPEDVTASAAWGDGRGRPGGS